MTEPKRDDDTPVTFLEWLGLTDTPRWRVARPLGIFVSVAVMLLFALALSAALVTLINSFTAKEAGLGTGGLIVALLGAPFLIWSTVLKHQTLALSETALFNDKVNAALQGLYSRRQITRVISVEKDEKVLTEWEDDIVQRNGAIDRLEGLANERPSEVPRIANMLSVYVRELSMGTAKSRPRGAFAEMFPSKLSNGAETEDDFSDDEVAVEILRAWAQGLKPFRTDVEKAAQTLGRLRDIAGAYTDTMSIDLRGANLQGFDLNGLCFATARLQGARMEGADLAQARMEGANLRAARMEGANLRQARMDEADLREARMEGANLRAIRLCGASLRAAQMAGADLYKAEMVGANLFEARMGHADLRLANMGGVNLRRARLEGADLTEARMEGTKMWNTQLDATTHLTGAVFSNARAQSVDFSSVPITADQVKSMFADASVTLPNGITSIHADWPAHWPKTKLNKGFTAAYTTWLATQP